MCGLDATNYSDCSLHGEDCVNEFIWVVPGGDSQVLGFDQQVCVVKQYHLRPLYQQEESELDEQHQSQLPYAADVEEHGAGQQGQQHAVAEILQERCTREGGEECKVNIQTSHSKANHECTGTHICVYVCENTQIRVNAYGRVCLNVMLWDWPRGNGRAWPGWSTESSHPSLPWSGCTAGRESRSCSASLLCIPPVSLCCRKTGRRERKSLSLTSRPIQLKYLWWFHLFVSIKPDNGTFPNHFLIIGYKSHSPWTIH